MAALGKRMRCVQHHQQLVDVADVGMSLTPSTNSTVVDFVEWICTLARWSYLAILAISTSAIRHGIGFRVMDEMKFKSDDFFLCLVSFLFISEPRKDYPGPQ
mmetsp:Transcript_5084/g.6721  ORF Transcript_5084/g.6721 Transcript_5084/m.6721 type:complete len:102 (+) Transcript_5084:686-991(+)